MLKNLTPKFLQFILTHFNLCPSQRVSPNIWKHAVVTMIPKGSKIATGPNNRAISLISCLIKLQERIVGQRLIFILEDRGILSKHQSGFRQGRSDKCQNVLWSMLHVRGTSISNFEYQISLIFWFFDLF